MQRLIGQVFRAIDVVTVDLWKRVKDGARDVFNGPFQGVIFTLILTYTAIAVVLETVGRWLDRVVGWAERSFAFAAMLIMTFLAFNEYLAREVKPFLLQMGALAPERADLFGLWALEGQMNMALLLMVVVGFLGGSLATQERKHIAVDAIGRILAPGAARFVRRVTSLVAAGLCYVFMRGSWTAVFSHSQDNFEGARIWGGTMAAAINALTRQMPGERVGPNSCADVALDARPTDLCPQVDFTTADAWLDAKYDAGLDPYDLFVFGYVDAGDRFPLWIPLLLLVVAFGVMSVRFFVQALYPDPFNEGKVAGIIEQKPGNRRVVDVVLAGAFPGALIAMGIGAWLGIGWLIVLASIILVFLGSPLFVAVGVGTLACWILIRDGSAETVVSDMFEATKKQELLSIPFFVLAGNLMTRGSIAARLIEFAKAAIGGIPGGLGAGAVAACAFFAAISGSSPVTVIAIGTIMFPMLIKEGYSERYSMGVLSTAGGLGIIIPPSIPMIVYAIMVSGQGDIVLDPATLFKAGILPGLFIASVLIAYTVFQMWPRDVKGVAALEPEPGWFPAYVGRVGAAFMRGLPSLFLPVLILGGIYGLLDFSYIGIDFAIRFTVTEAAAVAVVYALFVELVVNRELKLKDLPDVFSESAMMMGTLFLILVIAISLNRFFVWQEVPEAATQWMLANVDSKFTFLIMVNLFLLALGCVMDILSAILIVAPLLAPIASSYGIHPVHFGIMFIVNLELGYLTPPLGINLFVASTVFERPILDVIRAVVPFLILMLFCLAVIVWVPSLSLFLVE